MQMHDGKLSDIVAREYCMGATGHTSKSFLIPEGNTNNPTESYCLVNKKLRWWK